MENNSDLPSQPDNSPCASAPWWRRLLRSKSRTEVVTPPTPEIAARQEFVQLFNALLADRSNERRAAVLKRVLALVIALTPIVFIVSRGHQLFTDQRDGVVIPVVKITGTIGQGDARADVLLPAMAKAFKTAAPTVVLYVDSPGGRPGDAERIVEAVRALKERHNKGVDVVFGNIGASAAYMIALAGDKIYAPRYSVIGSIGAVMQATDASEAAHRFGLRMRTYTSGELKATGDLMTAPTPQQDEYLRELIQTMGLEFVKLVREQRKTLALTDLELRSGRVWLGTDAKRLGLVDETSTLEQYLAARGAQPRWFEPKSSAVFGGVLGALSPEFESIRDWVIGAVVPSIPTLDIRL